MVHYIGLTLKLQAQRLQSSDFENDIWPQDTLACERALTDFRNKQLWILIARL
jgi:hypothetical protein